MKMEWMEGKMRQKMYKVRVMKAAMAALLSLSVSGCGIGLEADDDANAQQIRDAKALSERYGRVVGTYEGTIANPATGMAALKAVLALYSLPLRDGTNSDGSVKIRPGLFGRLSLVNAISETDYLTLAGEYRESGELILTSLTPQTGPGSGEVTSLSVEGYGVNGSVSLAVKRQGGLWGRFEGQRVSLEASAPPAGEMVDRANRFRAIYRNIEGDYEGEIVGTSGGEDVRYRVRIRLSVDEKIDGGSGVSIPYLVAKYSNLEFPPGTDERYLAVEYNSQTRSIGMTSIMSDGKVPGAQFFALEGRIENREMNLRVRSATLVGTLKAKAK